MYDTSYEKKGHDLKQWNFINNKLQSSRQSVDRFEDAYHCFVSLHSVNHVNRGLMLQTFIEVANSLALNKPFPLIEADGVFICFLHLLLRKPSYLGCKRIYASGFPLTCLWDNSLWALWVENAQLHSFDRKLSLRGIWWECPSLFSRWPLHLWHFGRWELHLIFGFYLTCPLIGWIALQTHPIERKRITNREAGVLSLNEWE